MKVPTSGWLVLNRSSVAGFESPGDTHLKEVGEFRKEHGHSNVPPKYAENPALGNWVAELRKRGKRGGPAVEAPVKGTEIRLVAGTDTMVDGVRPLRCPRWSLDSCATKERSKNCRVVA